MKDIITREELSSRLEGKADIEVFECVESTNTVASQRIDEGCRQWHTVIAAAQTGGQGRLGRSFFSPKGTGLYMSCVLYPDPSKIGLITGMAAVCVSEALEEIGIREVKIKWVNDIFVGRKKVCGILAKSKAIGDKTAVILGIGINVYAPDGGFPDEIRDTAGYLFDGEGCGLRTKLAEEILKRLFARYGTIGADDAAEQYRQRCLTVGRDVTVYPAAREQGARAARALFVDDCYRLRARYEDGGEETLFSGEVSVKI